MDDLEKRIGYSFREPAIREQAFTHRSYRHERPEQAPCDNERLEFLGDAVLGFLISRMLYEAYPRKREGQLSKLRAMLVSETHLASKARQLDLGSHVRLGRGEELSGGQDKDSILADALESLIAGLYLDGGLEAAALFVEQHFSKDLRSVGSRPRLADFKSYLQEALHARGLGEPQYRVVDTHGPDHERSYLVAVTVGGEEAGRGAAGSKKGAEQQAAQQAIEALGLGPRGTAS